MKKEKEMMEMLSYIVKNMVTKSEHNELVERVDKIDTRQVSMEIRLTNVESDVKETKDIVNSAFGDMDSFVKKIDTETMERTALHHKVDRHNVWIHDIASNVEMELMA